MTFDLASFAAGFTIATVTIGGWLVAKLIEAQADIALLTEARDRNADDWLKERTLRMELQNAQAAEMLATVRNAELAHDYPTEGIRHDA